MRAGVSRVSELREVVWLGEDWGRHPTTAQFLARHLLDSFRIIWINSLGWRTPRLDREDLTRIVTKLRQAARGPQAPAPNLVVYTPLLVPWYRSGTVRALNAVLVERAIRRLTRRFGFTNYSLVTTIPAAEGVFRRMRDVHRVYYCADEHATFPGLRPDLVRHLERNLLQAVDLVVTTSRGLLEAKSTQHQNVTYLPHGVDFDHFSKAADPALAIPEDLRALPRPIIGFHGLIREVLDFGIIDTIARLRPNWSIVLVGNRTFDAGASPQRPNIHYLGARSHAALPGFVRAFDVCLIPYRLIPTTIYMNPVKLREYLAAGKPVVSTPLPEVLPYREVVQIAATGEEFVSKIEASLREDESLRQRRIDLMRNESWAARAAELADLLKPLSPSRY